MNPTRNSDDERSALESIEHELYSPKVKINEGEIHEVRTHRKIDLPTSWGNDTPIITKGKEEGGFSFGMKLLLLSTIFLFIALLFSAWRVISLRNVVSATNIDMTADISPYIEGGEATPLVLTLRNRNISALESARITLMYKQGNGSQDEQEKVQEKRELGTVKQNEYKKQDFSVVLYGSESETRDIVLKLEYKVLGSNAIFTKLVTAQVIMRTPPISVTIDGPDKLSVGQSGTYTFRIKNNSATSSLPSVLALTLPNSFIIESITPKPLTRTNSWSIEKLKPGESKDVTVTGSFEGKQGEIVTLQAKIGSQGESSSSLGIVYSSESADVMLRASPLTLTVALMSESGGDESLRYGDKVTLVLTYINGSSQVLEDVSVKLSLSGDAALYNLVNPTSGYYDSLKKTITWDKGTFPDLAVLPPGSQGVLQVIVPIVQKGNNSPALRAVFTGTASSKETDDVVATVSKTWGVQGIATLVAHTQYKTSPFANTGPIPPEPNKETTYTANLKVSAQNALSSARVSFVLPTYVSWKGLTTDSSKVTYDSKTRTVVWDLGKISQGTVSAVDISLGVKPSQSHVGGSPAITSGIILDADEEVSKAHLKSTLSPLTTVLYNETWPKNPSVVTDK